LPGPDIGKDCAAEMRAVQEAGFECGIHTWDHVLLQDNVAKRDAAWSVGMMRKAAARFTQIFGVAPRTHGAAGWQMNAGALHEHDAAGYAYASDGRCLLNEDGTLANPADGPNRLSDGGQLLKHIQMPTTLPTLDELLGREIDGTIFTTDNIAAVLLTLTKSATRDHVYTLHAEFEGQKLAPVFKQLLAGRQAQG
jgi:peptidoglycan/xylan/chitin deacetylase (PgdA/CDA1 family)